MTAITSHTAEADVGSGATEVAVLQARACNVASYLLDDKPSNATALLTLTGQHSYNELKLCSDAIASYLAATATRGDRIILTGDNGLFWVASYVGILRAGMVAVPLPPGIPDEELASIITFSGARVAFAPSKTALRSAALKNVTVVTDTVTNHPELANAASLVKICKQYDGVPAPDVFTSRSDLAALMFTSGSTGKPRGVMVTHGNIVANTESIIQYLELTARDRIMTVLPFHYCFGTSLLHTHLRVGGTLVLDHRFMFPEKVLQRMAETECTGFAGVPSHYQILLKKSAIREMQFPKLRYVQQAGGGLAAASVQELREALPTTKVFVMYGQTEATARLSYLPPEMLDTKLGSIGRGIPGVKLSVMKDGVAVEPGSGESGEIVAEGENITLGYWDSPEDTAICFRNGKLYTGDLATVDQDGFIYIVGRAKDFIKCGGKRVSCRQIEERLLQFDLLVEAAVVGMPDEVLGEAVKAYVVARSNEPELEAKLKEFCKALMPAQWVPKEVVVVESLPKNSAGKVIKAALR